MISAVRACWGGCARLRGGRAVWCAWVRDRGGLVRTGCGAARDWERGACNGAGAHCKTGRAACGSAANGIGDAGVEALARALPPSLTTLDLDCTCLLGRVCAAAWRAGGWCAWVRDWGGLLRTGCGAARDWERGAQWCGGALQNGFGLLAALQATASEMRAWRRWRAHCRRV